MMGPVRAVMITAVSLGLTSCSLTGSWNHSSGEISSSASQEDVTELEFNEFFVKPVGPFGLTLTEKLGALDGKQVRILGYMVQQEKRMPGRFLLTSRPVRIHEEHYGLADDLPPATVHVLLPDSPDRMVSYSPRPMVVTGILSTGNREEPDGRISVVRLLLLSLTAGPGPR